MPNSHPSRTHDGWAGISFDSFGARVGIWTNAAEFLPKIEQRLPPCTIIEHPDEYDWTCAVLAKPGSFRLTAGGSKLASGTLDIVLESLGTVLDSIVATNAREMLFVHAGVVLWGGRAIVIPGRTRSGKTTLVAGLLRAGATYFSDEFAVFDEDGLVHAYRRPLRLREGTAPDVPLDRVLPAPVGVVAVTHFDEDASWAPREMTPAEGVVALLDNTPVVRAEPERTLVTAKRAVDGASIIGGVRGEADEVVPSLLNASERESTR